MFLLVDDAVKKLLVKKNISRKEKMSKLIVGFTATLLASGLLGSSGQLVQPPTINNTIITQANEQTLIQQNRDLLVKNGQTAKNIAAKVGAAASKDAAPSGSNPLQVNQQLILQNRAIFTSIATKVGATVPSVKLLLGNRQIVRAIAEKLGVKLPAPPELSGSMVQKNNTLLQGNGKALAAIAAKVGATVAK
ncbi:MAG: hypothetical protein EAZ23_02560 [Oscillatoriales cyanobacterium]|nr:MAG: hypothetical protein EAZ23_02560 [Oscillatoriales cyanobacterium]